MKTAAYLTMGFTIGAVIGFVWSQGVKSRISGSVKTGFDNGKFVVSFDVKEAAIGGLMDYLDVKPAVNVVAGN